MTVKDLASELKRITQEYGDTEIIFRDIVGDDDFDVCGFYYDEEANRLILTSMY